MFLRRQAMLIDKQARALSQQLSLLDKTIDYLLAAAPADSDGFGPPNRISSIYTEGIVPTLLLLRRTSTDPFASANRNPIWLACGGMIS
jgi:hypothetical protein